MRPFPLQEKRLAIARLCPIGEGLTNLLQNHSAEAGTPVFLQGGTGFYVTVGTVIVRVASEALRRHLTLLERIMVGHFH